MPDPGLQRSRSFGPWPQDDTLHCANTSPQKRGTIFGYLQNAKGRRMTNLEIIKGIYSGNADQIAKNLQMALAPRFEWTEAAGFPYAGTYHSLEEVAKNVFVRLSTEWIDYRADAESFYDAGNTIIVTGYYRGNYRKTNGRMDASFAHIWTLENGKIVKYVQNVDTKKVWDAMQGV